MPTQTLLLKALLKAGVDVDECCMDARDLSETILMHVAGLKTLGAYEGVAFTGQEDTFDMKKQSNNFSMEFRDSHILKSGGTSNLNIYLAGPFFNETEIKNIEYAEQVLKQKGFSYFSPMRHEERSEEPGTPAWARKLFEMDKAEIEKSDIVVALYYGSNSDSGTAWECGYAYAIGRPVVLVHVNREADSNLMLHCGCRTNTYLDELEQFDFDAMPLQEFEGKMY